jgi:hypothetical protein
MKRLLLLLLASSPLYGVTPTISGVTSEIRDRAIILRWITDQTSGDAARCSYDYDTVALDRRTKQNNSDSGNGGRRQCAIYDLIPATKVYVSPQSRDNSTNYSALLTCAAACTNCTSSDVAWADAAGSGLNCDAAGQYPYAMTAAEDTDPDPDPPVHSGLTAPPAVTGSTHVVASNCSDLASKKSAAESAAGAGGTVEALILPAGVECPTAAFQLQAIANSGRVLVKSGADPKLLPPANTLTDKTYRPHMGRLVHSAMSVFGDPLVTAVNNARGYYFENIEIGPPDLDSPILTAITMTITAIDTSTETITVNSTAGLATGNAGQMVVVNLEGTGVRGGYGPMQACNVTGTTLQLRTGVSNKGFCNNQGSLVNLEGAYSGGGTVRRWVALPITSIGACAGGGECLTIPGHGIPNFPNMTITAGTSTTITVGGTPSEYQIGSNSAVHIQGTAGGNCDGLWSVSVAGSVLTLSRSGQTPNCSGVTAGTVHRHRAVSLFRTNSDTLGDYEPRAFNVEAVDANTIEVLELSHQAGASGGYLFWEMEALGTVIDLGKGELSNSVEDVTFDRMVSLACLPWLEGGFLSAGAVEHVAVVNSRIESCMWQRMNPVNGVIERIHGLFQAHQTVGMSAAQDLQIRNNYAGPAPFFFNDTNNSGPDTHADDYSLTGNYIWNPDWTNQRSGVFRGHYFHRAFASENKSAGARISISANYFKGWFSNFQQISPAISLSLVGSNSATPNGFFQVSIENNVFDRGTTILQMDTASLTANKRFNLSEKLRFANNLIVKIDAIRYTSDPGNAAGGMISTSVGVRDFVIERNTFLPERAVDGRVFQFSNHRSSGVRWLNNILGFTEGSNTNRVGIYQETAGTNLQVPAPTQPGGLAAFDEFFQRGTAADPLSVISGNIAIPMLKNSSAGTYAVKAASTNPSDTHCQSSLAGVTNMAGLPLTYVGNTHSPCDQSLNQRLALVFEDGAFTPTPTYAGKGADLAALSDAQGLPGPVAVIADHDSVSLSFPAPTTEACAVDLAAWAGAWATTWNEAGNITRGADPSPDQEQEVAFGGLNPNTTYAYRGHCKRAFIGQVTTAGAP